MKRLSIDEINALIEEQSTSQLSDSTISLAHQAGRSMSNEQKAKISKSHVGKEVSAETREAMRRGGAGKRTQPKSEAHKLAIGEAHLARTREKRKLLFPTFLEAMKNPIYFKGDGNKAGKLNINKMITLDGLDYSFRAWVGDGCPEDWCKLKPSA